MRKCFFTLTMVLAVLYSANAQNDLDPIVVDLTGGTDSERAWVLDIHGAYFDGPLYFFGLDNGWQGECMAEGEDADCWDWSPTYAGNEWLMPDVDYGTMTFGVDDQGNLYINTVKLVEDTTEAGTFSVDNDAKTMSITGATMVRDTNRIPVVTRWDSVKIFSVSEYGIQLAVMRDNDPNEGDCLLVYNFVRKGMDKLTPLMKALVGDTGEGKDWRLDMGGKAFGGPLYFFGTDNGWQGECMVEDGDCWDWSPVYADNDWLMPDEDYGTMTFSLDKDNDFAPVFTSNKLVEEVQETGTFELDEENKILTITGGTMLRDSARIPVVTDWENMNMFSLDDISMQLGVIRDNDPDEGEVNLVYNFITQEFFEYEPTLAESIEVTAAADEITVKGDTLQMVATILPDTADVQTVTWSVNNDFYASITEDGELIAKNNGTVTVIATSQDGTDVTGEKEITIAQVIENAVESISVSADANEITETGGTLQLSAEVLPAEAQDSVTWSVDDVNIATVSATGLVTATGNGDVLVSAIATDGSGVSGSTTITITGQAVETFTDARILATFDEAAPEGWPAFWGENDAAVIENPFKDDVNASDSVGHFNPSAGWGAFAIQGIETPFNTDQHSVFQVMVYAHDIDTTADITARFFDATYEGHAYQTLKIEPEDANKWVTLEYDLSYVPSYLNLQEVQMNFGVFDVDFYIDDMMFVAKEEKEGIAIFWEDFNDRGTQENWTGNAQDRDGLSGDHSWTSRIPVIGAVSDTEISLHYWGDVNATALKMDEGNDALTLSEISVAGFDTDIEISYLLNWPVEDSVADFQANVSVQFDDGDWIALDTPAEGSAWPAAHGEWTEVKFSVPADGDNISIKFESVDGGQYHVRNLSVIAVIETLAEELSISSEGDATTIIEPFGSLQLYAHVTPEDASIKNVTWKVNRPDLASIDANGLVTAKAPNGNVTAIAMTKDGSQLDAFFSISISSDFTAVESITVTTESGETAITSVGGTLQMVANISPEEATVKAVTWEVSHVTRATIDENGLLTAIGDGDVTVTATSTDGTDIEGSTVISISGQTSVNTMTESLSMYPNPVASRLYINTQTEISRVEVYALDGRMVKAFDSVTNFVDVSDLRTGTYIVRAISTDNSTAVGRMIKK